jgi:uncharacterized surface protein with fasciclin (FAS1) repeats
MKVMTHFLALLIAGLFTLQLSACETTMEPDPQPDIVDVAIANQFNTLVAAVQAAGLEATLRGPGPFTVFAPTEEAFAALPDGTLDTLLLPENQQVLQDILTYHVVSGKVTSSQVVSLSSAETAQGGSVEISVADGVVFINGAQVVLADVEASNGIIHVIDTVLLPPSMQE